MTPPPPTPGRWYDADSAYLPAHHQPAVLVDLALSRGIAAARILRGTGLDGADLADGHWRIGPRQFLMMLDNAQRLLDAPDTAFLLGQRLLPGHYGAVSHALQAARDLGEALEHLVACRALLAPLLAPRLCFDERHVHLYWLPACGVGALQPFLLEASMTAVVALGRQLSGQRLPWRFRFARAEPRHVAQYWVHLGEALRFDGLVDVMSLERSWLHLPWPGQAQTAARAARQASAREIEALPGPAGWLDAVYDHLHASIRRPLNLERVALDFAMSPATFKRKLQAHGTSFQAQLDLVRTHVALHLYENEGWGNEAVAAYLRFNDTTNFRRSFRRWTGGLAPSEWLRLRGGRG